MKNLTFKPLELSDKQSINPLLLEYIPQYTGSPYTFTHLYAWRELCEYEWALSDQTLIVSVGKNKNTILQPFGAFPKNIQQDIIAHTDTLEKPFEICCVTEEFIHSNPWFAAHFRIIEDRDSAMYVYYAPDLAELKGNKYHAKRNFINALERDYAWKAEQMHPGHWNACTALIDNFLSEKYSGDESTEEHEMALHEANAVKLALADLDTLEQRGIIITIEDQVVAFSVYEALTNDTAIIHFEKALRAYKGLHQLINRETAKIIVQEGFKYINREEDMGNEGMRKAKLSYRPVMLQPLYLLVRSVC